MDDIDATVITYKRNNKIIPESGDQGLKNRFK
jgi:hypothetical protein